MPSTTGYTPRVGGGFDVTCAECGVVGVVDERDQVAEAVLGHIAETHGGYRPKVTPRRA